MVLWWAACADPRVAAELAAMDAWQVGAVQVDPFPDHRTDAVECPLSAVIIEGSTIEVDTGACPYVLLEQPLLADVQARETVEIVFWHNDLASIEPAEAHVAFAVDGTIWFDRQIPIPSTAAAYAEIVTIPEDAPAGASLVLHLHNHGANTWNVLRLTRRGDGDGP